jgi:hypothetical protein
MNQIEFAKSTLRIVRVGLLGLLLLSGSVSIAADEGVAITPDEIVAELKTKLDLSEQQTTDLTAALTELANNLDALIAKQEAGEDGDNADEFINGVKQAQAEYQEQLKTILSSSQLKSYDALREQVIMDAMKDLAEIKLLDIQPKVQFSDDQMKKLIPVVAESMRGFIKIAWEHAGKRLRVGQKLRVARDLKRIQSNAQKQVQQILTGEQYKKWEEVKAQQQAK